RIGDPEIDVAVVGVPRDDDARLHGQIFAQAWIDAAEVERFAAGGGEGVELGERDQLDLREARIPRRGDDFPEEVDGALVALEVGADEREIAAALRFVGADLKRYQRAID